MSETGERACRPARMVRAALAHGARKGTVMAQHARATDRPQVFTRVTSPVGQLTLVTTDQGLSAILWENDRPDRVRLNLVGEDHSHPVLLEAGRQLAEYFAGRREHFTLPLAPSGTAFQREVWEALRTIPFGETRSYAQIAQQIGHPRAMRAVGAANGRNPLSIVVPCHRVIGSTGALTGFAGGLDAKARLLALEGRYNRATVSDEGRTLRRDGRATHAAGARSARVRGAMLEPLP
jgi:methylated-DNA-[protein]-cysteine S-methyltransferase